MHFYKKLARRLPDLGSKLKEAKIGETPEVYVKRIWKSALMLSFGLTFVFFMSTGSFLTLLSFPILLFITFPYFARSIDVKIEKIKKEIDKEILFAGRFLIIEIESGVPVYDTFKNLSDNYETIGPYFQEIIDKVDFGTSMETALNEVIASTPSANLRKVLWQIANSFKTGSNISGSLVIVLDQISREQDIVIKEYGRKLNPIAMFYMMAAIIVPSLGITMLAVLASFLGFKISIWILLGMVVVLGFVQFMFLAIIRSSRPPMAM
jgi:archaeal flagellar protein FlaJ